MSTHIYTYLHVYSYLHIYISTHIYTAGSAAPGGHLAPGGAALHGGPRPRGLVPLLQPPAAGRLPPGPAPAHLQHPAAGVGGNNNNNNNMLHYITILPQVSTGWSLALLPTSPVIFGAVVYLVWANRGVPRMAVGHQKISTQIRKIFNHCFNIRTWWRVCGARSGGTAPPGSSWTLAPGSGTTPPPPRGGSQQSAHQSALTCTFFSSPYPFVQFFIIIEIIIFFTKYKLHKYRNT